MTIFIYISTLLLHYISYFNPKKVTNMYLNASNNIQRLSRKKNNENAQTYHVEVAILI